MTVGSDHTCIIASNDINPKCVGDNHYGQLDIPDIYSMLSQDNNQLKGIKLNKDSSSKSKFEISFEVKSISSKYEHTCLI